MAAKASFVHLRPRLSLLASLIPPCSKRLVDVGCDHGRLGAFCLQTGRAQSLLATDIHAKPLARAEALLQTHLHMGNWELLLQDGLGEVLLTAEDVVVIAGMGGLSIRSILEKARDRLLPSRYLLHPTRAAKELRDSLADLGLTVEEEFLCKEEFKLYPVLLVRAAKAEPCRLLPEEAYWGPSLLRSLRGEEACLVRLSEEENRLRAAAREETGKWLEAYREKCYRSLLKMRGNPEYTELCETLELALSAPAAGRAYPGDKEGDHHAST